MRTFPASRTFAAFLRDNGPWSQLVALGNITVEPLANAVTVAVGPRVGVTPLLVPHRDEYSETVGFVIATPSSTTLLLPDIDSWDAWTRETGVSLEDRVRAMDHLFVDATFFADGELPGRDMSQIPHPRVRDTMERLAARPAGERRKERFIHYNHSNPIRYPDSAAPAEVAERGFAVARAGTGSACIRRAASAGLHSGQRPNVDDVRAQGVQRSRGRFMEFWEELKRRNVVRVGIAYLVGAWLLLQLAEVLSELLSLPPEIGPIVVGVVAIGFPVVLLAAWVYELTPQGLKRESEVDRGQPAYGQTGSRLNLLISVLLALAVGFLLYERFMGREILAPEVNGTDVFESSDPTTMEDTGPLASGPASIANSEASEPGDAVGPVSRQSIAVLPFDNRSRLADDEFFVEGIHDDLLTTLARIGGLKVISRTSVSQYADTPKTIPQIAAELGVATVMEGAVQRAGDTVRINVQLIDAATDEHLWAEIYDRELTAENLFAIQSEISGQIARSLEATLTEAEARRINERPTDNLAAYSAYLRGRQLQARRNTVQLTGAMAEFRRAVELDPDFALAWVGIGETATHLTRYGTQHWEERNRIRAEAASRAIELDPELGEAWVIYAYTADGDAEAEERFRRAIELSPSYATAYLWYANFIQGDFRRLEEAQQLLDTAVTLDPLSPILRHEAARNLQLMGHTDIAARRFQALLDEDPEFVPALDSLAQARMLQGEWVEGVQLLRRAAALDPGTPAPLFSLMSAYLALGYGEGIAALRERFAALSADLPLVGYADMFQAQMEGRFEAALEHLGWVEQRLGPARFLSRTRAQLHMELGEYGAARAAAVQAYPKVFDADAWTELPDGDQDNLFALCFAGYIMTRTGDVEPGEARIRAGLDYAQNELPRFITGRNENLATSTCSLALGDPARALLTLETLSAQGDLTWVRMFSNVGDTMFAQLRDQPRFVELLRAGEAELERQRQRLRELDAGDGPGV